MRPKPGKEECLIVQGGGREVFHIDLAVVVRLSSSARLRRKIEEMR